MNAAQNIVVVGAQWGDEGKGKVVDALAVHFDIVARYQGGANAGHTVVVDGKKFVFQLLPSGIVRPNKIAVVGNGVVVDLEALVAELDVLAKAGIEAEGRLRVSDRAHLILPYHRSHEAAAELARGVAKIGTTAKGIGPSYEDKAGRRGLRTSDLRDRERFREKCLAVFEEKNRLASALFPGSVISKDVMTERCLELAPRLLPCLRDTSAFLNSEMDKGRRVLFEGAQGTLLDIDLGTYPYVTSSSAAAGGASTGTGVGPTRIGAVVGVSKAYATRVGSGPFPTEASGSDGEKLRERGGEYGAVTGRPRRCGWFDVPAARYSTRVNDLKALIITKLDILDQLAEIPVGVEYVYEGRRLERFPAEIEILEGLRVRYKSLPGWQQSTFGLCEFAELPSRAKDYLRFISDEVGVEIAMISTGPDRDQTIWVEECRAASLLTAG